MKWVWQEAKAERHPKQLPFQGFAFLEHLQRDQKRLMKLHMEMVFRSNGLEDGKNQAREVLSTEKTYSAGR